MIDQMVSLAFSVHNSKGVYAVLVGSGLSKSAKIPTGWDIVKDLIDRIALLHKERVEPDHETWYRAKFDEPPSYSNLLRQPGKTRQERQGFLKSYIEPTSEQRDSGERMPTKAHKAIAGLVASGHIKVVLTTNFDRLLELALAEAGFSRR